MFTEVTHVTVLVENVEEALAWYSETMGLEVRADEEFAPGMRWVTVAPSGGNTEIVLQEPNAGYHGEEMATQLRDRIGQGTMTVIGVEDCQQTVDELRERGVTIVQGTEEVPWGIHAIIEDLYGNPYNLVETA